ncbi:MAG: PTS sugar transporter subunit IIC [Sphingomonadales bacterium]|nr:PTS sugar transporter subunit IIC [Sphingomonadales bacterium]
MNAAMRFLNRYLVPALTAVSDNVYLAAIRAGMVSVVPLTIIGGLFLVVAYLPVAGWEDRIKDYLPLLKAPVTATFGLLSVFVSFAIAYDLGKAMKQEAVVSASMATLVFLLVQLNIQPEDQVLAMDGLGSKGLFTAVLIALITVRVQKFFTDQKLVIRLPESVPPIVYESFLSLTPMIFLVLVFWLIIDFICPAIAGGIPGISTLPNSTVVRYFPGWNWNAISAAAFAGSVAPVFSPDD